MAFKKKGEEEIAVVRTQRAPVDLGKFKVAAKDFVEAVPTEEVGGAYFADVGRYNRLIRGVPQVPIGEGLSQIETIVSRGAPLTAADFTNPHKGRRETPTRGYPEPWLIVNAQQQAESYQRAHPELDASCIVDIDPLLIPSWCDQRVQWRPRVDLLGKIVGATDPYVSHYGAVAKYTAGKLAESYGADNFVNYLHGALTERHIRLNEHTRQYLEWSDSQAKGDYVPELGSFGRIRAGWGVADARGDAQVRTDLWVWPFVVIGNFLIFDHVRHGLNGLLHSYCGGDEYDPDGKSQFEYCLFVLFSDRLRLRYDYLASPPERWGMPVGWSRR